MIVQWDECYPINRRKSHNLSIRGYRYQLTESPIITIPNLICSNRHNDWELPRNTTEGNMKMSKSETHQEKMTRKKLERKNRKSASNLKTVKKTMTIGELSKMQNDGKIIRLRDALKNSPEGTTAKTIRKTVVTFSDVKTPTTVEEFRENLSRFFVKDGGTNNLMVMNKNSIPIDEISSFDDIYTITKTGFGGDGSSPSITPTIDFSMDDWSYFDFFDNEDNFTLYDNQNDFIQNSDNVKWYTLDNQILRVFYSKVLGEFSGYSLDGKWVGDTSSKHMSSLIGKVS